MTTQQRQQGFTLVEVITVMLVLVAIASITVESSKDFVFQNRYDITKDRYEKIKKAIIGDPNQVINGQPNIEGFVKDVGRLPFALQELLDGHFCTDTRYFTQASCEGATPPQTWAVTPNWKKPYISSAKAFDDITAIPDGWGNTGAGNYGWEVSFIKDIAGTPTTIIAEAIGMNIQSKGKNGCINGGVNNGITCVDSVSDVYDADYPIIQPAISTNDWGVLLPTNITVTIAPVTRKIFVRPTLQTDCENSGGNWSLSTTPMCIMSSEYNETQCTTNNGTWNAVSKCSIIQPNITSSTVCLNFGGTWNGSSCAGAWSSYNTIQLCLSSEKLPVPLPVSTITENGLPQTVSFTVPLPSIIPIGQAAFSVNIYDLAQNPACTLTTYPAGRQPQIVTISPRSTLNFNW